MNTRLRGLAATPSREQLGCSRKSQPKPTPCCQLSCPTAATQTCPRNTNAHYSHHSLFPLTPSLPPGLRHKPPVWQEHQPVLVVSSAIESTAPDSSHTRQFALLIVATALILSKMLNHLGHCSLQVCKTSLFFLGLGKMLPCSKGRNIIRSSPRDVRLWDVEEAEVGTETRRGGTEERIQPVGILLLSQEHQMFQELEAQTKGHQNSSKG